MSSHLAYFARFLGVPDSFDFSGLTIPQEDINAARLSSLKAPHWQMTFDQARSLMTWTISTRCHWLRRLLFAAFNTSALIPIGLPYATSTPSELLNYMGTLRMKLA